jgi:hypothetical protein
VPILKTGGFALFLKIFDRRLAIDCRGRDKVVGDELLCLEPGWMIQPASSAIHRDRQA